MRRTHAAVPGARLSEDKKVKGVVRAVPSLEERRSVIAKLVLLGRSITVHSGIRYHYHRGEHPRCAVLTKAARPTCSRRRYSTNLVDEVREAESHALDDLKLSREEKTEKERRKEGEF